MPATKKKKIGVPMRAMIATLCFLLGTLAVLYSGGRGRSNTNRTGGTVEALLLGQNQDAPVVYDPIQDFCFKDNANANKYCWYTHDYFPFGNWVGWDAAYGQCGDKCTIFADSSHNRDLMYNPDYDFCFADTDNPGKYCWFCSDNRPYGNWKGEGGYASGDCGSICTNVAHPSALTAECGVDIF